MSRTAWCWTLLALCMLSSRAIAADKGAWDEPTPEVQQKITTLIVQLGNDEFAEREAAARQLVEIGLVAYRQVENSIENSDPEIRYRAARILAQLLDADFERRLQVFVSGKDEVERFPVPGWKQFKKLFGDTKEWREFFVELQKGDREIFQAIEGGPKEAQKALTQRLEQFQLAQRFGGQQQMPLASAMAMLFAGSSEGLEMGSNANFANLLHNICYQQTVRDGLTSGPRKDLVRKMLGTWIASCEDASSYQAMMLAMQYELSEGLKPAVKLLNNEGTRQPYMSQFALLAAAKFGDASHIPSIEKLLTDKGICNRMQVNNVMKDTQVRDVALLALLHLTKQDKKVYGFERLQEAPPYLYNMGTMGLDSDQKRDEALKMWQEFKTTGKKPEPKPSDAKPAEAAVPGKAAEDFRAKAEALFLAKQAAAKAAEAAEAAQKAAEKAAQAAKKLDEGK